MVQAWLLTLGDLLWDLWSLWGSEVRPVGFFQSLSAVPGSGLTRYPANANHEVILTPEQHLRVRSPRGGPTQEEVLGSEGGRE